MKRFLLLAFMTISILAFVIAIPAAIQFSTTRADEPTQWEYLWYETFNFGGGEVTVQSDRLDVIQGILSELPFVCSETSCQAGGDDLRSIGGSGAGTARMLVEGLGNQGWEIFQVKSGEDTSQWWAWAESYARRPK